MKRYHLGEVLLNIYFNDFLVLLDKKLFAFL